MNDTTEANNNTITNITNIYEIKSNDLDCEELITRDIARETEQVVEFINELNRNNSHDLEYESEEHITKNAKGSRITSILDKSMDKDNFILKEQQQRSINGFDSSSSNIGINIDVITTSSSTSSTCEGMIHDHIQNLNENINSNVSPSSRSLSLSSNLSSPIQSTLNKTNNHYNQINNIPLDKCKISYNQMHDDLFINFNTNQMNCEKRFEFSFNILNFFILY